jgi:hypothetical protein
MLVHTVTFFFIKII